MSVHIPWKIQSVTELQKHYLDNLRGDQYNQKREDSQGPSTDTLFVT